MAKKISAVFVVLFILFSPLTALSEIQEITFEIEGMD